MESILYPLIIYLLGFVLGIKVGYVRGRIAAARDLITAQEEISQTLKLAEMKGIDTSQLTTEEVIKMTIERRKNLNDN